MKHAIGIDLGGTHIMAAIVDRRGRIEAKFKRELTAHDPEYVVGQIADVVGKACRALKKEKPVGIGLGSPGNIDGTTGVIRYSPNFGWRDVPLGTLLFKKLGQKVHLLNDARCAALGEYEHGCGRGTNDFVLITLGTGIGGGIVAGGRLILGNAMGAGEVGHHQIRPSDGFVCNCGKIGCFEAQASGTGMIRHAMALAPSFPRSTLLAGDPAAWGSKMIREAYLAGDAHATTTWKRWLADLAIGIANIVAFVNPQLIALGGGVGQADKSVLARPLTAMVDVLTTMVPPGQTKIVTAKLGNDAGAVGAAELAFRGGIKSLSDK